MDDPVAGILRLAGPREAVPFERAERVRAAARRQWQRQLRRRRLVRVLAWAGAPLAAAAALFLGFGLLPSETPRGEAAMVARVERVRGGLGLRPGGVLNAGDIVETRDRQRVAFTLSGGTSVRIDEATTVRLASATTLVLERGALYVDSGHGSAPNAAVEVRTPWGLARDIGTQFEVRVRPREARVRVREGTVRLVRGTQDHEAQVGDELTTRADGTLLRAKVDVHGREWAWTADVAPPHAIEGRTLRSFLDWISRENGWRLRFDDASAHEKAADVVVHGSIDDLTPEDALDAVLPTSGFEHRLKGGVLHVGL